jgi:histidine triad (HIT) family protein
MVPSENAMPDCIFCQIVEGRIPAHLVHQDELVVAFDDIEPQAPTHLLVVPRRHLPTLNDLGPGDEEVVGRLFAVAALLARRRGFADRGWRAVINVNRDAHQLVFHVHLHVLAGRSFGWPPG